MQPGPIDSTGSFVGNNQRMAERTTPAGSVAGDHLRQAWAQQARRRSELIHNWWDHTPGVDRVLVRHLARTGDYLPSWLCDSLIDGGVLSRSTPRLPMPDDVKVEVLTSRLRRRPAVRTSPRA